MTALGSGGSSTGTGSSARTAGGLAAAVATFIALLAILHRPPTPPPPPPPVADTIAAVHQFQCPDSTAEAIAVDAYRLADLRVAGDTLFYPAAQRAPVILCGPTSMVRTILAHPEAGHGAPAILNPPATTSGPYIVPALAVQNGHIIAPSDTTAIAHAGLTALVAAAINAAHAAGILADSVDTTHTERLAVEERDTTAPAAFAHAGVLWYHPARATRARTFLEENAGACWGGDPDTACAPNGGSTPTRTPTTWLASWTSKATPPPSGVLRLTAIIADGNTATVPLLAAGGP